MIIDEAERALGTAVQTAVKRADEQAFALANGQNLMFCEDAARRLNVALKTAPGVKGFKLKVVHAESLHSHDAISLLTEGETFKAESLDPKLFSSLIHAG